MVPTQQTLLPCGTDIPASLQTALPTVLRSCAVCLTAVARTASHLRPSMHVFCRCAWRRSGAHAAVHKAAHEQHEPMIFGISRPVVTQDVGQPWQRLIAHAAAHQPEWSALCLALGITICEPAQIRTRAAP